MQAHLSLVDLDLIRNLKLFQEPEDALGARLVEVLSYAMRDSQLRAFGDGAELRATYMEYENHGLFRTDLWAVLRVDSDLTYSPPRLAFFQVASGGSTPSRNLDFDEPANPAALGPLCRRYAGLRLRPFATAG